MKKFIYLAALTLIPAFAMAQKSFDDEVNSELDKMYDQNAARSAAPTAQVAQMLVTQPAPQAQLPAQPIPVQQVQQPQIMAQPVYQQPLQPQVQVMPVPAQRQATTVVEASPLTESRADKMRKQREETELQTEQKIVEKLEISRMEDEKRRAEVLFGDKFNNLQNPPTTPVVAAAPAPVPVVQETTVAAPAAKEEKLDRDAVRQEISAALDESKAKEKTERKSYFSVSGGMDNYSNTNIQPQYALGLGFGQKINDRMLVEGQFNYADAHIQEVNGSIYNPYNGGFYPRIADMVSYQGVIEAKYEILGGMFRPLVGGAAAYTYRKYSDIQFGSPNDTGSSNAIDVGLLVGADLTISESLALGFEARYLWNIANQSQVNNSLTPVYSTQAAQTPENMGYLNMSLVARMSF